jgi:calmodulin
MAAKVKAQDTDAELRAAFQVFDRDGSGTINTEELKEVMKSIGESLTDEEIEDMMKEADKDGNGAIDCKNILTPLVSFFGALAVLKSA